MTNNIIKLEDFFKFYSDKNTNQKKAISLLLSQLPIELKGDSSEWVKIYRTPLNPINPIDRNKEKGSTESERIYKAGEIDWTKNYQKISKYFTVGEVTQGDRRRIPLKGTWEEENVLRLAKELDKVREWHGKPLGVTSWFRPEPVNTEVGGVRNSKHTLGIAADIYVIGDDYPYKETKALEKALDSAWGDALGYGAWKGFVHLDIRNNGGLHKGNSKLRWDY